jgi:hypothetical protein
LFRSEEEKRRKHHDKLLHGLTKTMRLVLPADPGQERMLDALRQYHPLARRALGGGFHADGGHLNLDGPTTIEPGLGAEANLPPDITVAYFPGWYPATNPGGPSRREVDWRYREKATYMMGGLAARFNGLSYPRPGCCMPTSIWRVSLTHGNCPIWCRVTCLRGRGRRLARCAARSSPLRFPGICPG